MATVHRWSPFEGNSNADRLNLRAKLLKSVPRRKFIVRKVFWLAHKSTRRRVRGRHGSGWAIAPAAPWRCGAFHRHGFLSQRIIRHQDSEAAIGDGRSVAISDDARSGLRYTG